jgi:hypothetical protein
MDAATIIYYDDNAESVFAICSSIKGGVEKYCGLAFPAGLEILGIGSGSGRDANLFEIEMHFLLGKITRTKSGV